jgi:hypothetical protein
MLIQQTMLRLICFCGLILMAVINAPAAVITGQEPITVNLGTGANVSYLVFNESTLANTPIRYAWHYDGAINPVTRTNWSGEDLFQGVLSASQETEYALSVQTGAHGLFTDFTIGGRQSRIVDPLSSPVWTYWISGGSEYVEYGDNGSFSFLVPAGQWMISPSYAATRWISNGSYDGWTIAEFEYPGTNPVGYYTDLEGVSQPVTIGTYYGLDPQVIPEPAPIVLVALSLMLLPILRAWKLRHDT